MAQRFRMARMARIFRISRIFRIFRIFRIPRLIRTHYRMILRAPLASLMMIMPRAATSLTLKRAVGA